MALSTGADSSFLCLHQTHWCPATGFTVQRQLSCHKFLYINYMFANIGGIYEFISCLYQADRATGFLLLLISNQNFWKIHPKAANSESGSSFLVVFGCFSASQVCLFVYVGIFCLCICQFEFCTVVRGAPRKKIQDYLGALPKVGGLLNRKTFAIKNTLKITLKGVPLVVCLS